MDLHFVTSFQGSIVLRNFHLDLLARPRGHAQQRLSTMSQQEEALHKVLQQIQTQYVVSQRQLNGVRAQLQVRERERRGAELTLKQIDEVDPEAKFYKGVGKMFIMEDRNTVRSELVSREKEWKEDIANLTKKQKFLEKQVSDAQGHLNDIFRASQASSS
ncbi:hypothetical protein OC835_006292 [Tilletia horrida]|nr:hypothetical protein OC835_006292 [Tilletia horrida]